MRILFGCIFGLTIGLVALYFGETVRVALEIQWAAIGGCAFGLYVLPTVDEDGERP